MEMLKEIMDHDSRKDEEDHVKPSTFLAGFCSKKA